MTERGAEREKERERGPSIFVVKHEEKENQCLDEQTTTRRNANAIK